MTYLKSLVSALFLLMCLGAAPAPAQDATAPAAAPDRSATGGAQTLEDILARQKGFRGFLVLVGVAIEVGLVVLDGQQATRGGGLFERHLRVGHRFRRRVTDEYLERRVERVDLEGVAGTPCRP